MHPQPPVSRVLSRSLLLVAAAFLLLADRASADWVRRAGGAMNWDDEAVALALDGRGGVVVTGNFFEAGERWVVATIRYDADGNETWRTDFDDGQTPFADAIVADSRGHVTIAAHTQSPVTNLDFVLFQYDPVGALQWALPYAGPSWDWPHALAVDSQDAVCVAGDRHKAGLDHDLATLRVDAAGVLLWDRLYDGPGHLYDLAEAIAVDSADNVIVAGRSKGKTGFYDYYDFAVVKYSSAGDRQWVRRYQGPGVSWDIPTAIAVDSADNVFVTGASLDRAGNPVAVTVSYTPAGERRWLRRTRGTPYDLAIDARGNVHVAGEHFNAAQNTDLLLAKYSSGGRLLWRRTVDGRAHGNDGARRVVLDAGGNAYLAGYTERGRDNPDVWTLRFSRRGRKTWERRYNGTADKEDHAVGITRDATGSVYVLATSRGKGTRYDLVLLRYDGP